MSLLKLKISRVSAIKAFLMLCGATSVLFYSHSFEFRSVQTLEKGPYRTLVEEESSNWSARYWASFYSSDAQKAFSANQGVTTQDITALYLGQSDFRTTAMFPDLYVPQNSEFYNPLLRTARLQLSTRYNDTGVIIGGNWDLPIIEKTGRVGVRASMPFKKIVVSKIDTEGVRMGAELENVVAIQVSGATQATTAAAQTINRLVLMRMDFAEALIQSKTRNTALDMTGAGGRNVGIGAVNDVSVLDALNAATSSVGNVIDVVAVINCQEGAIPDPRIRNFVTKSEVAAGGALKNTVSDMQGLVGSSFAVFKQGVDYSTLAEFPGKSLADRQAAQNAKAQLWICPIFDDGTVNANVAGTPFSTVGLSSSDNNGALGILEAASSQVTANVYEWFHDQGIDFQPYTAEGAGDLSCQFFFNYAFNQTLTGEGFVGFKAPTGGKALYESNPYKTNLGNGGHWEVNFGAMGTFSPSNNFVFRADAQYAFVLSHVEERHTPFENAQVKLGPKIDVDVKWQYFVANLDLNVLHFWSRDITGLVGYQFYYKRTDQVSFSDTAVSTWLGQELTQNATTLVYAWAPKPYNIDTDLAVLNTNSIAHKLKVEFSFVMTDWLEFYGGASYAFAGRNTLRSTDTHFGFNIGF